MQALIPLLTFEYEQKLKVRTVTINGEPWFYAADVCKALEINNPSQAITRLDKDDLSTTEGIDSLGRTQKYTVVNESGLYDLVFQSRTDSAKRFKRWVTKEVLPRLRKTGVFAMAGAVLPAFVRRFNDNWDRVSPGHFSVINELFIRIYGRFEQLGHVLAEKGSDGKELRPDISVGKTFAAWLKKEHPAEKDNHITYKHAIDDREVDARQYPLSMWPLYATFVDTVWMRDHAPEYLRTRDPAALELLPKLLPAPDPMDQKIDVAASKFFRMKEELYKLESPTAEKKK